MYTIRESTLNPSHIVYSTKGVTHVNYIHIPNMKLLYHHPLFNHFVCVDCGKRYFCFVWRWYSFAFASMVWKRVCRFVMFDFSSSIIPCDDRIMYNIACMAYRQPLWNICCGTQILVLQAMLYCQEILAAILKNGWKYTMSWWRFSCMLFLCVTIIMIYWNV